MRAGQWVTLGGVTALVAPITISTSGVWLLPIAILSGLALVKTIPSALHKSGQNTENAKAAAALAETAEIDSQSGGVEEDYSIPYRPAYEEMKQARREQYAREAYDLGHRSADDILKHIRSKGVSIGNDKRDWAKFQIFQWDNGVDDTVQL